MSCDFKLTNPETGDPVSVNAHKLVTVSGGSLQAVVGVTGLAVLDRVAIGDWIARRTGGLGLDATLDSLLEALSEASRALGRVRSQYRKYRHLTFVVGAIEGSQSVVALLSNFQSLRGSFLPEGVTPGTDLRLDVARPSNPRLVAAGQVDAVRKEERKALERLLRAAPTPEFVRGKMARLNQRAAGRTVYISEGCNTATILATGRAESQAHLVEQTGNLFLRRLPSYLKHTAFA